MLLRRRESFRSPRKLRSGPSALARFDAHLDIGPIFCSLHRCWHIGSHCILERNKEKQSQAHIDFKTLQNIFHDLLCCLRSYFTVNELLEAEELVKRRRYVHRKLPRMRRSRDLHGTNNTLTLSAGDRMTPVPHPLLLPCPPQERRVRTAQSKTTRQ